MNSETKTLKIGRRQPKTSPTPRYKHPGNSTLTPEAYGPSIQDNLEALLADAKNDSERPSVRLKSSNHPDFATNERIFLIRRNPFPHMDEYQPAHTEASQRSLIQWIHAGIGDEFPAAHRVFAEKDLVRTLHDNARIRNKESKRAWNKYASQNIKFQDEIAHEFDSDNPEYLRGLWQTKHLEQDTDLQHEISGLDRLANLTQALTHRYIITQEGRKFARAAQLLAMIDALPVEQVSWILPEIRTELAVNLNGMTQPKNRVLRELKNTPVDWDITELTEKLFLWKRIFWTLDALHDT